ncbi:histone deacetylase complex subunit SAP18-like [Antedon mediterranea]|uniref:histone deacetylase complex subunit SAP18-like n=1 Tax=Antedon mediterranea TaxID=105859 RepID=UPI003AF51B2B
MSSVVESRVTEVERPADKPVDREKCCPLLLRVFCNNGRHHRVDDFSRGLVPSNELQIYTWMDATLKELSSLVKEVNPEARKRGTYFDFAIVSPDTRRPVYRLREIGVTCSGRKGPDDNFTLAQKNFIIGDYIDIAVSTPPRGGGGIGGGGGGMGGGPPRREQWGR